MRISSQDLILEFHTWLKENTDSELTFLEVKEIVTAPFTMVQKTIKSGIFASIRLTGFGLFFVYPRKIRVALADLQKRYESGNLSHNSFNKYYNAFKTYLDEHESRNPKEET